MSGVDDVKTVTLPVFSGGDVVRLFAATYLPLCRSLGAAGAVDTRVLAQKITACAVEDEGSSWSGLALALAQVLEADAHNA
jgi:predicted histidine transporter YuiF (NhaC family)